MEFQTLRKSHKKQIIMGAIAICVIGGALTFSLTRAKYEIANDLELAKGTINYKAYDFKIMAMYKSDDKTNYTEIEEMPSEGYTINESKSYCNMSNGNQNTNAILKTIDGNHSISKLKKNDKCFIYFDKKTPENVTELIASLNAKTTTPNFSQVATTDEGVFITDDPMYGTNAKTYYWRGAVTNNYVKFANFCWRIIRINGDGSIRLIYDGITCHANGTSTLESIAKENIQYNLSNDQSNYVGWTYTGTKQRTLGGTPSNAKSGLEDWYVKNITGTKVEEVADGKFCNDRNVASGYTWALNPSSSFNYAVYKRIDSGTPTLSCPSGDTYTLNIGLITADEVMYAGGGRTNNDKYYLYNSRSYSTMSPIQWYSKYSSAFIFELDYNGCLVNTSVNNNVGLRPVINLKSDVTFSGGDGTMDSPYIVQQ